MADEAELERNPLDLQLQAVFLTCSPWIRLTSSQLQASLLGSWDFPGTLADRGTGTLPNNSPGEAELPGCPDPYVSSFIGKKRVSEGKGWMARSCSLRNVLWKSKEMGCGPINTHDPPPEPLTRTRGV